MTGRMRAMQNQGHLRVVMESLLCEEEGSNCFIWMLRARRTQKVGGSRDTQAPGTWGQAGQWSHSEHNPTVTPSTLIQRWYVR